MPMPLVSVVTTTRNRKALLKKLIHNLQEQHYKNIEHIVIDAASSDGTQDLLKRYEKKYNLRWRSEKDRMQTEGVNKGLRLATGDLITVTHDDDFWLPDGIGDLAAEFDKDDLALAYGDSYSLFADGRRELTRYRHYHLSDMVNGGYQIPQHCCLFRSSYLRKVGWLDENIEHVAEYELFLRMIRAGGRYRYLPRPVAVGFQHEQKASWVCWNHSWDETWEVNRRHGGRLISKFALVYLKNRYFRGMGELIRTRSPRFYEWLKKIFKTPKYV